MPPSVFRSSSCLRRRAAVMCALFLMCAAASVLIAPTCRAQQTPTAPPVAPAQQEPVKPSPQAQTPPTQQNQAEIERQQRERAQSGADVLPDEPLTLAQAIGIALDRQPSVSVAVANRQTSEQRLKQSRAQYVPRITPQYNYSDNFIFGPTTQFNTSGAGAGTGTPTGGNGTGTTGTGTGTTGTGTGTTTGGVGTGTTTGGVGTGLNGTGLGTSGTGTGTTTTNQTIIVSQGRSSTTKSASVGLTYRLWDSGTRDLTNRQSRQNLRSSVFGEENTRQVVIGNVADSYFNSLRTAALVRVSEAQVARAKNTLDAIQAQVDVGLTRAIDVFQAQADYLNAQVNLLNAQNNAANAQAQLKNTLGILSSATVPLADVPAPDTNALPTATLNTETGGGTPLPSPIDFLAVTDLTKRYIDVALRDRPDLLQIRQGIESNETSVRLSRVNAGLLVTADVGINQFFDADGFGATANNNRAVQLGVTYPLLDGGSSRAAVRANQAVVRSSRAQLDVQRQQVAVEVEQAFRTLNQTRATIPAARAAQEAAQKNYDAALESRKEGVGTIVDVITAQTQLVTAQTSYVQAVYDYYTADSRLARAIGQAGRIATNSPANGR